MGGETMNEFAYLLSLAIGCDIGLIRRKHLPPLCKIWPVHVDAMIYIAHMVREGMRLHLLHARSSPDAGHVIDEVIVMLARASPNGEAQTSFQLIFDAHARRYRMQTVWAVGTEVPAIATDVARDMGLTKEEVENGLDQAAGRAFALGLFCLILPRSRPRRRCA